MQTTTCRDPDSGCPGHAADLDLQAFDGGIDVAGRGRRDGLFAQHVPGLDGLAKLELDAVVGRLAQQGEAEFEVRHEPLRLEGHAPLAQFAENFKEILHDEVRQHEAVVQRRAPADQRLPIGHFPEAGDQRPHQQLLRQAHPRVRRHFEAAELDQPQAAGGRVGRIQLVDAELGAVRVARQVNQQIAEEAIDSPGRRMSAASPGNCVNAVSNS